MPLSLPKDKLKNNVVAYIIKMQQTMVEFIEKNRNNFPHLNNQDFNQALEMYLEGKNEKEIIKCLETWEKSKKLIKYFENCTVEVN